MTCRTDLFMSMRPLIRMSCPTDSELTQPSKGLNLLTLRAPCRGGRTGLSTQYMLHVACRRRHMSGHRRPPRHLLSNTAFSNAQLGSQAKVPDGTPCPADRAFSAFEP